MPRLACWNCGRQTYATSLLESLFIDERRCPRCGAPMNLERRGVERRERVRRQNPPGDPGPPSDGDKRRTTDRRAGRRRNSR